MDVVSPPSESAQQLVLFRMRVKRFKLVISEGVGGGVACRAVVWCVFKLTTATYGGRPAMPEKLYSAHS